MIALLCPTRGRPEQFGRMQDSAFSTANDGNNVQLYACTNGASNYARPQFPLAQFPTDCPTVFMWNNLAEAALTDESNKLFMLASDDMIFATPGWDQALIDHYNSLENKIHVYHLQDSRDPQGTPHPIVTREYICAMGYFIPPIFLHWFVDTWTVELARSSSVFTHLKDYMLIHDKPSDKGQPDETHSRIRNMGWHARDQAVNDSCQHYLEQEKSRLDDMVRGLEKPLGFYIPLEGGAYEQQYRHNRKVYEMLKVRYEELLDERGNFK